MFFRKKRKQTTNSTYSIHDSIIVVSGLPRSGTSMMMRMIAAGGIEIVTDEERQADFDNPAGYFEFEKVKQLAKDATWLKDIRGKGIKVISMLLYALPMDQTYKVIFMQRKMEEILASQRKMLERRGEPSNRVSDREMAMKFDTHSRKVLTWLVGQKNMETLIVGYNDVIASPRKEARRIARFLGDLPIAEKMVAAVDQRLYRQRSE